MNLDRLNSCLDTNHVRASHVAIIGAGGSSDFIKNLARCGVSQFTVIDPDFVESANVARQGFRQDQVGMRKVSGVAAAIRTISPAAIVHELPIDVTKLDDQSVKQVFAGVNLFVFATDSFAAQARGIKSHSFSACRRFGSGCSQAALVVKSSIGMKRFCPAFGVCSAIATPSKGRPVRTASVWTHQVMA